MNLQKVREIIGFYKKHFDAINREEIYKWRAVKHFQRNWDIAAEDFAEMLDESLGHTANLLVSGNYFPRRMLILNANKEPETVRKLFTELHDEENDWVGRIKDFQSNFASLNSKHFQGRDPYQDDRAVVVYLTLRYPDIYFFYKFTMFKEFVKRVEYPFEPKKGATKNLTVYFNLCELLREEIVRDTELLELHTRRLAEYGYSDNASTILTQDVIYATVEHFQKFENTEEQRPALNRLIRVNKEITPRPDKVRLKGRHVPVNYTEKEKARKRLGDLGELLVLKYEQQRLKRRGSKKQPEHVAKTRGDGEGYDILSFDESGVEMFIEVKTTTGNYDAPFFITRNELEKSIIDSERFYLYRLFDFNEKEGSAKFLVKNGSLETLCINPILYRITVEEVQN